MPWPAGPTCQIVESIMKFDRRLGRIISAVVVLFAMTLAWPALSGWLDGGRDLLPTNSTELSRMPTPQNIQIQLGEPSAQFLTRFAGHVQINSQPSGLDFLSLDWRGPAKGRVTLDQPDAAVSVDHVIGVQTFRRAADDDRQGLTRFAIYAGLNDGGDIGHDAARVYIHGLLSRILAAGWQQMVDADEPRLAGAERLKRTLASSNLNGLDARYVLPLREWMQVEDGTPWSFVRDDAVLQVTFRRDAARLDEGQPGAYFLSLNWMSVNEHFREMVDPDDRARWRDLIPVVLEQARQRRSEKEEELRKAGWHIDASYVDPQISQERR